MRRTLLTLSAAACAMTLAGPATVSAQAPVALLDMHAHMMVENITPDEEIALLKKVGLNRVLFMHSDPEALSALARKYPDFIIPALSITPRGGPKGLKLDEAAGPALQKLASDKTICAFGEISGGAGYGDTPTFRAIYAAAEATGAPISLHIDLVKPETVAALEAGLKAYPKMKLILAHLGWTADAALIGRLLDAYPNLYTDVSIRFDAPGSLAWRNNGLDLSILDKDEHVPADWLAVMKRHPDRFLFATDINSFGPRYTIEEDLVKTARKALAPLPRPLQDAIGHGNAEKLLKGCGA